MKKLLIIFFLLAGLSSKAQDTLSISDYGFSIANDTVSAFSTDSISVWVVNESAVNFNDTLHIYTSVLDSASASFWIDVDTMTTYTSINAGDSVKMTVPHTYYTTPIPNQYHYDINVIVIWPVGIGFDTGDQFFYTLFITLSNSVHELDLREIVRGYPNPVSNKFTIESDKNLSIERVRIYDQGGRMLEEHRDTGCIDMQNLLPGTYLLELEFRGGERRTIRVMRQ